MAVNREFSKEKEADFFNIVVWGKPAESCANYLKKGRLVAVNGSMRNNNYEDKNGVKHYNIEVNANRVEFLEWGDNNNNQQTNNDKGYNDQQHPQHNTDTQNQQQNNQQQQYQNDLNGFQAIDGDESIPF